VKKVSKDSVHYRLAGDPSRRCGTCVMFHSGTCDLVKGSIAPGDTCDRWEARVEKSAETPRVSTQHSPLGTHGLWHTPSKKVPEKQQLPAYVQNTAKALMRDHGMAESEAIATAINALRQWAQGRAFGGKVKVTPAVREAAQRALSEWEHLKQTHH
jgi:hypothetical protein